jgi:hypothetical protein
MVPAMDEAIQTSYDKGKAAGEAYSRGFLEGGGVKSPPKWAISMGQDIQEGVIRGIDLRSFTANVGNLFDKVRDQAAVGEEFNIGMDLDPALDRVRRFKDEAASLLEASSPSGWAERLGSSVAQGFASTATLEPQAGDVPSIEYGQPEAQRLALEAFLADVPGVEGQDMAVRPYLLDVPLVPQQAMAVQPYLLDMPDMGQVDAPVTPGVAAAGVGGGPSFSRTNNLTVNAQYAYQSERSLRQDMELYRMLLS